MLWIRTFLTELHTWQWLGILVARLAVGLLFFLSGRGKLFLPERREQMRETLIAAHVPFGVAFFLGTRIAQYRSFDLVSNQTVAWLRRWPVMTIP